MAEENGSLLELQIDDVAAPSLKESARWTKFISIAFFVFIIVCVLAVLLAGTAITTAFNRSFSAAGNDVVSLADWSTAFVVTVVMITAALLGIVAYTLYNFSVHTRRAVDFNDQQSLEKGIRSLKNYFLILGIFGILGLLGNLLQLIGKH